MHIAIYIIIYSYGAFALRVPSAFIEELLLCTSCNYKLHINMKPDQMPQALEQ